MTNWKFDHTFADLDKFSKYFVGADKFADRMLDTVNYLANSATTAYPPFNLKKTDENKYVIEMAVAGFGKQDLEMTLEDNRLIVKGQSSVDSEETAEQVLHKGISDRAFTRQFTLADNVVINNAALVNGLLKIWLEHIIPEDKKPKKINIEEKSPKD